MAANSRSVWGRSGLGCPGGAPGTWMISCSDPPVTTCPRGAALVRCAGWGRGEQLGGGGSCIIGRVRREGRLQPQPPPFWRFKLSAGARLGHEEEVELAEAEDAEHAGVQQRTKQVRLALELLHFVLVAPHRVLEALYGAREVPRGSVNLRERPRAEHRVEQDVLRARAAAAA